MRAGRSVAARPQNWLRPSQSRVWRESARFIPPGAHRPSHTIAGPIHSRIYPERQSPRHPGQTCPCAVFFLIKLKPNWKSLKRWAQRSLIFIRSVSARSTSRCSAEESNCNSTPCSPENRSANITASCLSVSFSCCCPSAINRSRTRCGSRTSSSVTRNWRQAGAGEIIFVIAE